MRKIFFWVGVVVAALALSAGLPKKLALINLGGDSNGSIGLALAALAFLKASELSR